MTKTTPPAPKEQRLSDYSSLAQRCVMIFEGLRRLGFSSDDIYFIVGLDAVTQKLTAFVILKTQGREFTVTIGDLDGRTPDDVLDEWRRIGEAYNANAFAMSECNAVFEQTFTDLGGSVSFLNALLSKGFVLPKRGAN